MMNRRVLVNAGVLRRAVWMAALLGWGLLHSGCATNAKVVKPEPAPAVQPGPAVVAAPAARPLTPLACTFDAATVSDKARALILEGVELHDRGDYAGAARKYQEVLAADPENLIALYELSSTEMAWGHNKDAVDHAGLGVRCRSPYRLDLFVTLGSALDNLDNPGAAIAAFQEGLRESAAAEEAGRADQRLLQSKEMLLYNLSMSLLKQGRHQDARGRAEEAALIRPAHPSPYLVLGAAHEKLGNRIPAILALLRFMCLEPTTERTKLAAQQVVELMDAGIDRQKKTISLSSAEPGSEGDFRDAEMALSLVAAAGGRNVDTRHNQLKALLEMLAKPTELKSFTLLHNFPFLDAVAKRNLLEPLAQFLMAMDGSEEAVTWVRANTRRVAELVQLAQAFKQ